MQSLSGEAGLNTVKSKKAVQGRDLPRNSITIVRTIPDLITEAGTTIEATTIIVVTTTHVIREETGITEAMAGMTRIIITTEAEVKAREVRPSIDTMTGMRKTNRISNDVDCGFATTPDCFLGVTCESLYALYYRQLLNCATCDAHMSWSYIYY